MDNRPIGIFDSGLGGLTAAKALRQLLPGEDIVYFADTGRMPYGGRSVEQLRLMAVQNMDFLAGKGVKAIIAACGTVSCNAGRELESYSLPVTGVLKAGAMALCKEEKEGPLGVIATQASIRSGGFDREIEKYSGGRPLISASCPDFAPLIEAGHISPDDELLQRAVREYLKPLKEAKVGALLLGCTHYGIIAESIQAYLGPEVKLVSASQAAAESMRDYLVSNNLCGGSGREEFYTSGSPEEFYEKASAFLGRRLKQLPIGLAAMEDRA